jgi:phytoene desaturase
MDNKRVVIVGAGPGGLTSAMILANRGFKVTVFEKEGQVGGRNAAIKLGDYTFDTGPTFLVMPFILAEVFQAAGRNVRDYLDFKTLDPLYQLKFVDKDVFISGDRRKLKEEIERKFPGGKADLNAFFDKELIRFDRLYPCLRKDYSSLKSFLSLQILRAVPHLPVGRSIIQELGRYFDQEKLQLCFCFQSKYIGMSMWECPAFFTIIPYVEHAYGIDHAIGGLHQISLAMAKVVEEEGGEIHTATPVKRLIVEGRAVKGVELEGAEKVYADEVILNADFSYAMTSLVEPGILRKYSGERLERKGYSCSAFMMYMGVDKKYDLSHHNIVFAEDYRANVEDVFKNKVLSDDMSLYIQNACVTDPSLAPEGKSTVYVLVPVPNNRSRIDWDNCKEEYREKVLAQLAARTPLTDLKDHIEVEKVITPRDWERDYNVYIGAIFNLAHSWPQMMYWRPRNKFEELDHCYLVGGGTHPGSGLPTIYESARISSDMICRHYNVGFEPPPTLPATKSAGA